MQKIYIILLFITVCVYCYVEQDNCICECVHKYEKYDYPSGNWVNTAKNINLDKNKLCADLSYEIERYSDFGNYKVVNYNHDCVIIDDTKQILTNKNGKFFYDT